jgi:TP901 family phage tail tape measure protein
MSARNEQAIVEIILKGQAANASLKDMEKSARALRAQLKSLPVDSEEFTKKSAEFQNVTKKITSLNHELKGTGGMFQSIGKEIKAFGVIAAGALGLEFITSKFRSIIQGNAELSDSLADIRKTTGMTALEADNLNKSLSQLDTRTPTKELRDIAIAAGQLGIAKNDVLKFTGAVDKMVVSLGDEFSGGASEVTKVMGGLRNIFTDIKSDKIDQDMLHIGNAINELASSGAATGPVVSDFANRIGGVGITLGLTSGQVLGLSATLQELNVSTERGGTSTVKILQRMTTHTSEFAKVAGMDVKSFTELVNRDLFAAFNKVVEGSKKGGASATAFGQILDKLGVDGSGASEVMAKLGSNTKLLQEKVAMANGALQNTNSIMAEFTMKNSTLGSEVDRLGKVMSGAFTNSAISSGIKSIIGGLADLFDNTKKVSEGMEEERVKANALAIELKTSNITNERRLEIYDELKAINPDIVDGIDRENISIEKLTGNLQKYNQEAVNKIVIQKQQEKIDESNEVAAEKLTNLASDQAKAYTALSKIQELNGRVGTMAKKIIDDENLSIVDKIKNLNTLARSQEYSRKSDGSTTRDKEAMLMQNILSKANSITYSEKEYSSALTKSNELLDEKNSLMKQLGISEDTAGKKQIDYTRLSTAQLQEYIRDAKESKGNFHREEAKLSQEELDRRQQNGKQAVVFDEETNKKLLAARKKLLDDIAALEKKNQEHYLSDREREEKHIFDKYEGLLKQVKKGSHEEIVIRTAMVNDLEDLDKKYNEKAKQAKEAYLKDRERAQSGAEVNEINAVMEMYDKLIEQAKTYNEEYATLEADKWIKIREIQQKYNEKSEGKKDKHDKGPSDKEKLNELLSQYHQYYDSLNVIAQEFQAQEQLRAEASLRQLESKHKSDLTREKRLLDGKIITQKEYDTRVAKLEADKALNEKKIKQTAAEKEKKAASFSAFLSGIESVAKTFAKYGLTPHGVALSALAAGGAAMRVATINARPIPEFATGGYNTPGGMVNNATLFSSSSGSPFIAGEKGAEWIAPNWMLKDPVTANTIAMLEAMRNGRAFAMGGNTATSKSSSSGVSAVSGNVSNNNMELALQLNRLNNILESGIEAHLDYDNYTRTLTSINNARSASAVG